jgi:hypothetical protein
MTQVGSVAHRVADVDVQVQALRREVGGRWPSPPPSTC